MALVSAALALLSPSSSLAAGKQPVVVELFTSQGCSSCPPADKFLTELAGRDDIIALSLHVDYWDFIGWKDSFAKAQFTHRQRAYKARLGFRHVYTPQMVIQGKIQAVGSDRAAVRSAIANAANDNRVPVSITKRDTDVSILIGEGGKPPADILLLTLDRRHITTVKRGENRGRTLISTNVIRQMRRVGSWRGKTVSLTVPLSDPVIAEGGDISVVLVQAINTGEILGAARLTLQ